jgi:class 3 adenylate cyclase
MGPRQNTPPTTYARSDAGYVAYQVFGDGPNSVIFITSWLQNIDVMWDEPALARYLHRLGSISRVIAFDKRGSGVSDPVPLHALPTLEQWMDDALVVLNDAGVERAAVIGDTEGGPMAALLAASHPDRVSALVLVNTFARWRRATDYPIGMPDETWTKLTDRYEEHWGVTADILGLTAPTAAGDPNFRDWFLRYQRLSMPRGAAAAMYRWVTNLDVRSVLSSVQVPTLVIGRAEAQHHRPDFGRYLAEHIPEATYTELPGADTFPFQAGQYDVVLDEVEQFLTGSRPKPTFDRVLGTILFTDIVGSTQKAAEIGDAAWLELRRTHDELIRDCLNRFRGQEVNHTGDGFLAVFDGPARAVTCAAQIVELVHGLGIETRAGLHTGEVEMGEGQVGGIAVHLASRIMAEAGPGVILTSATVKNLVLGSGIEFIDRGPRRLKGVPDTWQLFQVMDVP